MADTKAPTPMAHEDAFFAEEDMRLLAKMREEREARIKELADAEGAEEAERIKAKHWMRCPKCGHEMKEQNLDGIEIDKCGTCEGIFFDRGELEDLFLKRQSQARGGTWRRIFGFTD